MCRQKRAVKQQLDHTHQITANTRSALWTVRLEVNTSHSIADVVGTNLQFSNILDNEIMKLASDF